MVFGPWSSGSEVVLGYDQASLLRLVQRQDELGATGATVRLVALLEGLENAVGESALRLLHAVKSVGLNRQGLQSHLQTARPLRRRSRRLASHLTVPGVEFSGSVERRGTG